MIHCAVEIASRKISSRLEKKLLALPLLQHFHKAGVSSVTFRWEMAIGQGPWLVKALNDFPELSRQIQTGLAGLYGQDFWRIPGQRWTHRWSGRTQIMGILNVTPDSFSDAGQYLDPEAAVDRALQMQEEGADWIDVGGESTRPGSLGVSLQEEKRRVLPVIRACAKALKIPLSVDTSKSELARCAVGEGAQMVNDISALGLDPAMGKTLAGLRVPVVLMHMKGKPRTMQTNPTYRDLMGEILRFFRERLDYAHRCGIKPQRILVDPGFGFGKTPWHNMELTRRLWEFKVLGRPILMGPSRKSTLGKLLGGLPPSQRQEATAAMVTACVLKGADLLRVHDVQSMVRVVKIADAIRYNRGLNPP
jgi:dihydropteroate synthase